MATLSGQTIAHALRRPDDVATFGLHRARKEARSIVIDREEAIA